MTRVFLASTSPRRKELLAQLGVDFDVISIEVDETPHQFEKPVDYVQRVTKDKAQAGQRNLTDSAAIVVAADTSVIVNETILGKPDSLSQAKQMLKMLSGHTHQVLTAVAVASSMGVSIKLNTSRVTFAEISEDELDWYVATNEGMDKAGSYAVQGLAARFIERIEGSYSGIMGLPLRETGLLLERAGYSYE